MPTTEGESAKDIVMSLSEPAFYDMYPADQSKSPASVGYAVDRIEVGDLRPNEQRVYIVWPTNEDYELSITSTNGGAWPLSRFWT